MKRSREVAAEARKTVVRAASEMLRARGIDEVSVADAMAAAGMTHGGFYKLFEDKQALVEEAFDFASKESARAIRDSAMQAPSGGSLQAMADAYLSAEHRANPGSGCPLSAQVSDAARQESGFRRVFTTAVYRTLDSVMEIASRDGRPIRRQDALAMLASLVGALSLARATDDENLASEILASTRSRIAALVSGDSDGAGASAKQKKRPSKS